MTQVPLSTLEKPQLLKETVEVPEIVITGSIRAWITHGIGVKTDRGGMRAGNQRGRQRKIESGAARGPIPWEDYAFEAGHARFRKNR